MRKIKDFVMTLHLMSVDVVIGAMLSSLMFWRLPNAHWNVDLPTLLSLGCATWIIYILDRLIDNLLVDNATIRHQFHQKNQYNLQLLIIVLFIVSIGLLFIIPKEVFWFGIVILIIVGLYFYILRKLSNKSDYQHVKEVFTAVLYATAVAGSAFVTKATLSWIEILLAFNFFLVVHQSILCFSYFEFLQDDSRQNLVSRIGLTAAQLTIKLVVVGLLISLVVGIYSAEKFYEKGVFLIEFLMSLATASLIIFQRYFQKSERYRWLGELVFWLPILLFFL